MFDMLPDEVIFVSCLLHFISLRHLPTLGKQDGIAALTNLTSHANQTFPALKIGVGTVRLHFFNHVSYPILQFNPSTKLFQHVLAIVLSNESAAANIC
jgi:hypothetical protein